MRNERSNQKGGPEVTNHNEEELRGPIPVRNEGTNQKK